MQQTRLFVFAVVSSLLGILLILYIGENFESNRIDISNIDGNYLENSVKVIGVVENLYFGNGVTIFNLKDNSGEIKVVAFDNSTKIEDGMVIEIRGIVSEYKNEIEIISEVIKSV